MYNKNTLFSILYFSILFNLTSLECFASFVITVQLLSVTFHLFICHYLHSYDMFRSA